MVRGLKPSAIYLSQASDVGEALVSSINSTRESIHALGARSSATKYLRAIEDAVLRRKVPYYRVLDGDEISHALHEHLRRLLTGNAPNVFIAWTRKEKYGNMTVTDACVVIAFPSPYTDRLSGLKLNGVELAAHYGRQILAIYGSDESVKMGSLDLEALCEECGIRS